MLKAKINKPWDFLGKTWCRRRESNPHSPWSELDFESSAFRNSLNFSMSLWCHNFDWFALKLWY